MKKRFVVGVALLALVVGCAVVSFAAPQLQPPAQKHKITLVNGTVMEGEIVAVTAKTISIRDASLGVIAVARENILKIEPPLDEDAAVATPPPARTQAPAPVRYADEPIAANRGGLRFGFSLSGGLGFINGGDFNKSIRDTNAYYDKYNEYWSEYNEYWGINERYTVNWKEMKSMTNFGGEILARFGRNFGASLGVEFINKKNHPGEIKWEYDDSRRYNYSYYYINYSEYETDIYSYKQTLSVTPITFNLYYYIPVGTIGEAYIKGGTGYYLGKLTTNYIYNYKWGYYDEYYWNDDEIWPPHYKSDSTEIVDGTMETTCNTIGFQLGAGFNINLAGSISLFGEVFYRLANFKDWTGSASWDSNYERYYGWWTGSAWSSGYPIHVTSEETGSIDDGNLWYYEFNAFDADYSEVIFAEDRPNESWQDNVRKAEININGIFFKVGVKVFFGGRR